MTSGNGIDILARACAMGATPYTPRRVASAFAIACRAVVSDIETGAVRVGSKGDRRYDVRQMLDEREHSPEAIDMMREALDFAIELRLVEQDRHEPHMVRIIAPLAQ